MPKWWSTCNVTKTIDVKGGETTIVYDSSYNLFPTSVTNALAHVTTTTGDAFRAGCPTLH